MSDTIPKLHELNLLMDFPDPDPANIETFLRMVIVGPSDSGKSYMFKYLAFQRLRKQYDEFVIFCGSDDTIAEYKQLFGTKLVFSSFDETVIANVIATQKKLQRIHGDKGRLKILLIFDDFANRKNKHESTILQLFVAGRHDCMSTVMILHDLVLVDRIAIDQCTHIITTQQTDMDVYDKLAKKYLLLAITSDKSIPDHIRLSKQRSLLYARDIMIDHLVNRQVLVFLIRAVKQQAKKPTVIDYVKWFKAGQVPKLTTIKRKPKSNVELLNQELEKAQIAKESKQEE